MVFMVWPGAAGAGGLDSGAAVHRLARTDAAKGLPVRITGVVTSTGPGGLRGLVIDDGTRGVFVRRDHNDPLDPELSRIELQVGMKVAIEGKTESGKFSPQVHCSKLTILGKEELPSAPEVTLPELLKGAHDCQRVKIRGTLQAAGTSIRDLGEEQLLLGTGDGRIKVISSRKTSLAPNLVDAEVEIEGVCYSFFNPRAELVGVRLHIEGDPAITVLVPPPSGPFDVPPVNPEELRPFSIAPQTLHRRKVSGVVTLSRSGQFLYLQSGNRGIRIQSPQAGEFTPRTEVIASGFVDMREQFAEIIEARLFATGRTSPLKPLPVRRNQIIGHFDGVDNTDLIDANGRLIRIEGTLFQIENEPEGSLIYLNMENALIAAHLGSPFDKRDLERFRLGSEVTVTGVCEVELSPFWSAEERPKVRDFRLLLRSADDIVVKSAASWWTPDRLWKVLGILFGLASLSLLWALILRRQVDRERAARTIVEKKREAALVEFSATMRERERLAADLHDTLEQSMTGIAFQLETMDHLREQPVERSHRHLTLARQMLTSSREDLRRSVWNLRSNILEGRTFRESLREFARDLVDGGTIGITTDGKGDEYMLPDLVSQNLLMLARECVTNALKHSAATSIRLTVNYEPSLVTLIVTDDGRGFDERNIRGPKEGHFGLQGMRERAFRLGADLTITSSPGSGTMVAIQVPSDGTGGRSLP